MRPDGGTTDNSSRLRILARVLGTLTVLLTVTGFAIAAWGTVWAYRYEARTAEDFVYGYVVIAWAGVLLVAGAGTALTTLATRRSRRP